MRYFTSDLHVGDSLVARWRGFPDVASHDEMVLGRLRETLGADDELWILGDVARANVACVRRVREAVPCERVHVVLGNHDERPKFQTVGGFVQVEHYDEVGKVAREGYKFCMSHYPMLDWNRKHNGAYMLHGHIHSLPLTPHAVPASADEGGLGIRGYNEAMREGGIRRYDVGVDANGYAPVSAEAILSYFA